MNAGQTGLHPVKKKSNRANEKPDLVIGPIAHVPAFPCVAFRQVSSVASRGHIPQEEDLMKRTILVAAAALAFCGSASAYYDGSGDPRVCDLTRTDPAEQKRVCAQSAASMVLRRVVTARINGRVLWTNEIDCVHVRTFLSYRCSWPTGAALVSWNPKSFKSSVTFGPRAKSYLAALRVELAKLYASGG